MPVMSPPSTCHEPRSYDRGGLLASDVSAVESTRTEYSVGTGGHVQRVHQLVVIVDHVLDLAGGDVGTEDELLPRARPVQALVRRLARPSQQGGEKPRRLFLER